VRASVGIGGLGVEAQRASLEKVRAAHKPSLSREHRDVGTILGSSCRANEFTSGHSNKR